MPRFRIVYQHEQEDCGAACLAMILRFYGFQVTLEAIKAFCGNMKNGITMLGLNRSAKRIGFATQAVRLNEMELFNLEESLCPFIAYWRQNHFVVVYKISAQHVYVADPAIGRIRYNKREFLDGFALSETSDGFVLLLKPENIKKETIQEEQRIGINLQDYIKPRWKELTWTVVSLLILSAIGLIFPFLTQLTTLATTSET